MLLSSQRHNKSHSYGYNAMISIDTALKKKNRTFSIKHFQWKPTIKMLESFYLRKPRYNVLISVTPANTKMYPAI